MQGLTQGIYSDSFSSSSSSSNLATIGKQAAELLKTQFAALLTWLGMAATKQVVNTGKQVERIAQKGTEIMALGASSAAKQGAEIVAQAPSAAVQGASSAAVQGAHLAQKGAEIAGHGAQTAAQTALQKASQVAVKTAVKAVKEVKPVVQEIINQQLKQGVPGKPYPMPTLPQGGGGLLRGAGKVIQTGADAAAASSAAQKLGKAGNIMQVGLDALNPFK